MTPGVSGLTPRRLFAADATGALITACLVGLVLARFTEAVGVPVRVLHFLAGAAVALCLFSLTMAIGLPADWPSKLKALAGGNLLYCTGTLAVVVALADGITPLGVAYFVGEAAIIAAIAAFEWRYATRHGSRPGRSAR